MFRSLFYKLGGTLRKQLINVESSSSSSLASTAKYCIFKSQNQNVVISNSRVNFIYSSFSTAATARDGNVTSLNSFVVSYLINSCGLSQNQAIPVSKKLNFKTKTKPDSVLTLFRTYGFTDSHISKLIIRDPSILNSNPQETLKPKIDFFISKGIDGLDLADFVSSFPGILTRSVDKEIIPSFDALKSIVQSGENVNQMIKRDAWIISADRVKRVMINVELLRNEGVPEANIIKYLILHPKVFTANRFVEILGKVKEMGFNHLEIKFFKAVYMLTQMSEASWRNKVEVFKNCGGWSEDQIQSAFRKDPKCFKASENKIMAVVNFLVHEMGYDSSIVAENPIVFCCSLQEKIIPRCSVIKVLVSRGLIKENISLTTLCEDESFLEKFVNKYEQQVPGLLKVFERQLNYQELLQN